MLVSMSNVTPGVKLGQQKYGAAIASHWSTPQECVPTIKAKRDDPRVDNPCKKYNNNDGRYTFRAKCKYPHKCYNCERVHSSLAASGCEEIIVMQRNGAASLHNNPSQCS